MRTDELFFEFFKLAPDAAFELFQITPACPYEFEAPVIKKEIKKVEKRMDGVLKPTQPEHPHYFAEFQGYDDKTIYWRLVHEIALYHELDPEAGKKEWRGLVLFLDSDHDPGPESLGPLKPDAKKWLYHGTLGDLLEKISNPSPVLDVLRPIAADAEEVQEKAPLWAKNLSQLPQPPYIGAVARLQEIFVQFVTQKLTHLSRKEIDRMLGLTPLEQTVAGQELLELGEKKGIEKGIEKGLQKAILQLLEARFGPVLPSVQAQINSVSEMPLLEQLLSDALTFISIEEFEKSLAELSS